MGLLSIRDLSKVSRDGASSNNNNHSKGWVNKDNSKDGANKVDNKEGKADKVDS